MKKLGTFAVVLATVLFCGAGAQAVTNGTPDGNRHPSVGSLVLGGPGGVNICSGTLIDPDTFLTASHCTVVFDQLGIDVAYVSFDPTFVPGRSTVVAGRPITNPSWAGLRLGSSNGANGRPGDVAVVQLFAPVTTIRPVALPRANQLDVAKARGILSRQHFTVVGYGNTGRQTGGGKPTFGPAGERRFAIATYRALTPNWLHLSQNPSTGDGGACYGDSGGPNFLGNSAVIAGVTVAGDVPCRATNLVQRLDGAAVRSFLAAFTDLP
jgi:hypothetical protein